MFPDHEETRHHLSHTASDFVVPPKLAPWAGGDHELADHPGVGNARASAVEDRLVGTFETESAR